MRTGQEIIKVETPWNPLIDPAWSAARARGDKSYLVHKDEYSRIQRYMQWVEQSGYNWTTAPLSEYRDYLIRTGLSKRSVKSILPTIRKAYERALANKDVKSFLMSACKDMLEKKGDYGIADLKATYELIIDGIKTNIDPLTSSVKDTVEQDVSDDKYIRLTPRQVKMLLTLPDGSTLVGKRDTVILLLMVGMGLREAEVCALQAKDVEVMFGDELSLRVREGKGNKTRIVPYGEQDWIIDEIALWCDAAGIDTEDGEQYLIRGIHSTGKSVLAKPLTPRGLQKIMQKYNPDGLDIKAHDLRRTYSRLMYMSGMDLERIAQNLGHASIETTRKYIGNLSAADRAPGLLFERP